MHISTENPTATADYEIFNVYFLMLMVAFTHCQLSNRNNQVGLQNITQVKKR